eukprot:7979945-Pyramimonas_sp.AAC.1
MGPLVNSPGTVAVWANGHSITISIDASDSLGSAERRKPFDLDTLGASIGWGTPCGCKARATQLPPVRNHELGRDSTALRGTRG